MNEFRMNNDERNNKENENKSFTKLICSSETYLHSSSCTMCKNRPQKPDIYRWDFLNYIHYEIKCNELHFSS